MLWPHSVSRAGCTSVPAPFTQPPPWNQTSTGSLRSTLRGVQTLRYRQSSFQLAGDPGRQKTAACTHSLPGLVAARTPDHGETGCGGFQRSGAASYGMPWNSRCAPCATPRTAPSGAFTTGPAADSPWAPVSAATAATATASVAARARLLTADKDLLL